MANHITHKIIFGKSWAKRVFAAVCPQGRFDFETLVPSPPHVYRGGLTRELEQDFPINWNSWNWHNWGTKGNCYNQKRGVENGQAFIKFDTASSIPYPILAAFANRFNIPFEHRYYGEGGIWGIETWGVAADSGARVVRITKRQNNASDARALHLELKGGQEAR